MKISPTYQPNIIKLQPKTKSHIAFGNSTDSFQLSSDFEKYLKIEDSVKKVTDQLLPAYSDRIDMEQKGVKIEIPNCLMLIDELDGSSKDLIGWIGENPNYNFTKITGKNNNSVQDVLWSELNKSKENFETTKRRTLIHVDGFDRLINNKTNAFENIEWLKDLMNRCAKDFGATIIFSTKDISKLNNEAIQPQRVGEKILIPFSQDELDGYNNHLESREDMKKNSLRPKYTTEAIDADKIYPQAEPVAEIKKEAEVKSTQGDETKPEEINPKVEESTKSKVETTKPTEVKTLDVKPEKPINNSSAEKKIEEVSKSSKAGKTILILAAIGAAIAGVIYFMKNKNKQHGDKENASNQGNISRKQESIKN